MTLETILTDHDAAEKTVTVYSHDPVDELLEAVGNRTVTVEHERVADPTTEPYVVVSSGGEHLGSVPADALRPLTRPASFGGVGEVRDPPSAGPAFQRFLELLGDTVIRSSDGRHLLAASKAFEDHAWRVGGGRLYVGFQDFSAFREQFEDYRRLGAVDGMEVHVFGHPDWTPPGLAGVTYHPTTAPEIGRFWFLAYDGDGDFRNARALLAVEEDEDVYRGFWTHNPEVVAKLVVYLEDRYVRAV